MTTRVATYSESRRAWREATTAGNAASAARDCAHAARLVAEEQESGATRWIEMANSSEPRIGTDEFCLEQGRLCNGTASNARRHAAAYTRWADEVSRRFKPDDSGEKARREVEWKLED
jgi:hypothetical protein